MRRATLEDLSTVADWLRSGIDCRLWSGTRVAFPVDRVSLPNAIEYFECDSLVLEAEGEVIGFGQLVAKASRRFHLARIIVLPARRGSGLGREITLELIRAARSKGAAAISLNVLPENEPALHLYASLGFVEAQRPMDERPSNSIYMEHAAQQGAAAVEPQHA